MIERPNFALTRPSCSVSTRTDSRASDLHDFFVRQPGSPFMGTRMQSDAPSCEINDHACNWVIRLSEFIHTQVSQKGRASTKFSNIKIPSTNCKRAM